MREAFKEAAKVFVKAMKETPREMFRPLTPSFYKDLFKGKNPYRPKNDPKV